MILLKNLSRCGVKSLTKNTVSLFLRQNSKLFQNSIVRNYQQHAFGSKKNLKELKFRSRDQIPSQYVLIYRAPMEHYVAVCKHTSAFTLSVVSILCVIKYMYNIPLIDLNMELNLDFKNLSATGIELAGFVVGFLLFNLVILYACNKFPLRIYKHNTKYLAIFEGNVPLTTRQYAFAKGEVYQTPNSRWVWHETMFQMGKKSVLLLPNYFKTPSEVFAMLKEQEPMDK